MVASSTPARSRACLLDIKLDRGRALKTADELGWYPIAADFAAVLAACSPDLVDPNAARRGRDRAKSLPAMRLSTIKCPKMSPHDGIMDESTKRGCDSLARCSAMFSQQLLESRSLSPCSYLFSATDRA